MRWEIERYVKLYRRDTPEWALIPWQARGLFAEILRKCDLDGCIECGRLEPSRAVAVLIGAPATDLPELARLLPLLLEDGCVQDVPAAGSRGRHLRIPNYREAQGVNETSAERMRRHRAKRKELENPPQTASRDKSDARDASDGRRDGVTNVTARAEPSRADTSRAEPSKQHRHRAEDRGSAAAAPAPDEGEASDVLGRFRRALADELAIASANPLRVAKPERAEAIRRHVGRLGLEHAVELAAEHARQVGTVPKYVDWFLDFLAEQDTPVDRAPGENPKPGDPDFNDPAAWRDHAAFLARTDGKTWEQATGLKRPVYRPPLTPEEEAAAKGGRS